MEAGSATRPRLGELVDVTIDTLAHGGAGVGRLDGYVVFVRQTVIPTIREQVKELRALPPPKDKKSQVAEIYRLLAAEIRRAILAPLK